MDITGIRSPVGAYGAYDSRLRPPLPVSQQVYRAPDPRLTGRLFDDASVEFLARLELLVAVRSFSEESQEDPHRLLGLDAERVRHRQALDGEETEDLAAQLYPVLGQDVVIGLPLGYDQRGGVHGLHEFR